MEESKYQPLGRFEEEINDNGEIIELCELNALKNANEFFQQKTIHKYTWIQEKRNLRSVIDYVLLRKRATFAIKEIQGLKRERIGKWL